MNIKEIETLLGTQNIKKTKNGFRYHKSYFYGFTKDATKLVEYVRTKIPNAEILDSGNHYHSFVGGAVSGTAKDSFLWVEFRA